MYVWSCEGKTKTKPKPKKVVFQRKGFWLEGDFDNMVSPYLLSSPAVWQCKTFLENECPKFLVWDFCLLSNIIGLNGALLVVLTHKMISGKRHYCWVFHYKQSTICPIILYPISTGQKTCIRLLTIGFCVQWERFLLPGEPGSNDCSRHGYLHLGKHADFAPFPSYQP